MPRFYFHLYDDLDAPDEEGVELDDLEAARGWALRNAQFIAAETIKDTGRLVPGHRIDIEDQQGNVFGTVRFSDAVKIEA